MAKHLKIFKVETLDADFILCPQSDGASFRYADLQMEANYVRTMVANPNYKHLTIDLGNLDYFGSEFIGALITIAREKKNRGGQVAVCNAAPQMLEVLKNMSLFRLWPYYATRQEALDSLNGSAE